jgi:hypothetical protein
MSEDWREFPVVQAADPPSPEASVAGSGLGRFEAEAETEGFLGLTNYKNHIY